MEQITVKPGDSGQRLDKYLGKYLKEAPRSFLYKMMRKKNSWRIWVSNSPDWKN